MMLTFDRNRAIRNVAVFCILGILLGHLFPIPIIVWRSVFVLLNMVAIASNIKKLHRSEFFVLALVVFCSLHFLFSLSASEITSIGAILFTVPTLILFKYLDTKGVITQKWINACCIVFLFAAVTYYRYKESAFINEFGWAEESGFTNNASTLLVGLLLFLLLSDKKIITWTGFAICWYFLVLSAKRGNIVEAVVPTLVLLVQTYRNNRRGLIGLIATTVFAIIGISYGIRLFDQNQFLLNKIENSGLSGRDGIWNGLLREWSLSPSMFKLILGYGLRGSHQLVSMSAHNDWLEILVDFGVVGLVLQIGIFMSLAKLLAKKSFENRLLLAACIGVWFIKSMISMGFKDPLNIFIFVTLGIVMSRSVKSKNAITNEQTTTLHSEPKSVQTRGIGTPVSASF